ncbi:hypothetical protein NQ317_002117 [Molorchus minor]|uniref:Uncharacterized protein n=1 Tax=Molorchus minor TaxID=1323400 RepID=A0ABQ9JUW4_9CUCU|nr:hypothetical protein NQ317_002117 [Molorchus minor]
MQHKSILQQSDAALGKIPRSRSKMLGQLLEKVRPNVPDRERSKSAGQSDKPLATPQKVVVPKKDVYAQASQTKCRINVSSRICSGPQMNIDSLEAHIKQKLHDIMSRRPSQPASKSDTETDRKLGKIDRKLSKTDLDSIDKLASKQRIMYKRIGKSCDKINASSKSDSDVKKCKSESEYQRISDATSVKAAAHETRSSPSSPKGKAKGKLPTKQPKKKVYPYSDGEDNVFYSMHDSADSLSTSTSRRSSFEGPDKTLVVVINRRNKNMSLAQKQRSWETFPPKRRHHMCHQKLSVPAAMPLRKADSFEGHEEAVKSLVAAVQETRRKPKGGN